MKYMFRTARSAKAFSLIEMLVVIAIIGILAALIFPVFAHSRAKAQQVRCLNQGRQLGMATMLYVQDWNGRVMRALSNAERSKPINNWQGTDFYPSRWMVRYYVMDGYVKNDEIWICPTAYRWMQWFAYGYKMTWKPRLDGPGGDAYGDPGIAGLKLIYIEKRDGPLHKRIAWWCMAFGALTDGKYYPHMKGSNYIYLDGHAAWQKVGNYWAPSGYPAPGQKPPVN